MRCWRFLSSADATLLSGELKLAGRLDARFFALLAAIDSTGSINRAARTAGYSYKGARLLLETAASLTYEPLLESATGGKDGGGTHLTRAGRDLLGLDFSVLGVNNGSTKFKLVELAA